eukprot:gene13434-30220_t
MVVKMNTKKGLKASERNLLKAGGVGASGSGRGGGRGGKHRIDDQEPYVLRAGQTTNYTSTARTQWQWKNDTGSGWCEYRHEHNTIINNAALQQKTQTSIKIGSKLYTIDLAKKLQILQTDTRRQRRIRSVAVEADDAASDDDYQNQQAVDLSATGTVYGELGVSLGNGTGTVAASSRARDGIASSTARSRSATASAGSSSGGGGGGGAKRRSPGAAGGGVAGGGSLKLKPGGIRRCCRRIRQIQCHHRGDGEAEGAWKMIRAITTSSSTFTTKALRLSPAFGVQKGSKNTRKAVSLTLCAAPASFPPAAARVCKKSSNIAECSEY